MEYYRISSSQPGRVVCRAKTLSTKQQPHVNELHYVTVPVVCGAGYSGTLPKKAGLPGVARRGQVAVGWRCRNYVEDRMTRRTGTESRKVCRIEVWVFSCCDCAVLYSVIPAIRITSNPRRPQTELSSPTRSHTSFASRAELLITAQQPSALPNPRQQR